MNDERLPAGSELPLNRRRRDHSTITAWQDVCLDVTDQQRWQTFLQLTSPGQVLRYAASHQLPDGVQRHEVLMAAAQALDGAWRQQQQLTKDAENTDSLTGLLNRRGWQVGAEVALRRAGRQPCTVLFCDIDAFKEINDQHGHPVGDQVLLRAAGLLRQQLRQDDVVARYGGDEFIALLGDCQQAVAVAEIVPRLHAACRAAAAGEQVFQLTCGIAACPSNDLAGLQQAVSAADQAMYSARHR